MRFELSETLGRHASTLDLRRSLQPSATPWASRPVSRVCDRLMAAEQNTPWGAGAPGRPSRAWRPPTRPSTLGGVMGAHRVFWLPLLGSASVRRQLSGLQLFASDRLMPRLAGQRGLRAAVQQKTLLKGLRRPETTVCQHSRPRLRQQHPVCQLLFIRTL